ncbi:MAG: peptidase MA family metallohydrolase [Geobacteraceae bacterium]|nr:peptidase MA family metallohydrolase [Geobacteraceae bacterium]
MIGLLRRLPGRAAIAPLFLLLLALPLSRPFAGESPVVNDSPSELIHRGEYEKALHQLQREFSLFPYDETARRNLAAAYGAIGNRHLERREFDEAAESFGHGLDLYPDQHEFAILRGIALYSGKRYDEAAIVLEQARQAAGENVVILFYLGLVRYDSGDLAGALEVWDAALARDPGNRAVLEMADKARRESAVESPMKKGYRSMFVISYDGETQSDLADAVLQVLESAYNRIGADLGHYPSVRVPVILYTRKDYRSVTDSPEWSGGLYDGKVRLPIGGAVELTPILRGVLFHEYTHVVVRELTGGNCPSWLNEGLAEVAGRREYDPPLAALEAAAKSGAYLHFADLEKSLASLKARDARLAYQQSYAMVRFMISAYGWHKVRDVLVNLGTGMTTEAAIAAAFADYGLDYRGIVQEWRATMAKEYGR